MEKDSALKYEKLQKRLKEMGRLVVSFSGGVDSTFLLRVAHDVLGDRGSGDGGNSSGKISTGMGDRRGERILPGKRHTPYRIFF